MRARLSFLKVREAGRRSATLATSATLHHQRLQFEEKVAGVANVAGEANSSILLTTSSAASAQTRTEQYGNQLQPELSYPLRFAAIRSVSVGGRAQWISKSADAATFATIATSLGLPPEWQEAFLEIIHGPTPSDFFLPEWEQYIQAGREFYSRWASEAYQLGWSLEDAFGLDATAPQARRDRRGLAWSLGNRVSILSLDARGADLVTELGVHQRWWRPGLSVAERIVTRTE